VEKREGIIHARYAGRMTLELVEKAAKRIRELLPPEGKGRILYDARKMDEPTRELTRWMLAFDDEIRPRVEKAATVAPDMLVEAQARAAFVNSPEHQFFHELEAALSWLKS
jgi:pilus assembly protein TadC